MPFDGIKIDAWRDCHAGIAQQFVAKCHAIVGEIADIGPDVKGAIGGRDALQAKRGQRFEQECAVAPLGFAIGLEHHCFIHRHQCCVLR